MLITSLGVAGAKDEEAAVDGVSKWPIVCTVSPAEHGEHRSALKASIRTLVHDAVNPAIA